MLLGFELPNVPVPDGVTWQQVDELRSTVIKVRPYHLSLSTREHIQQRTLAVILRSNADDGVTFDPRARIDELRAAIEAVQPYTHRLYCVIDNEPNHHNNNARPSTDYWARIRQVFESLALEFPEVKYVSPPMAVAQDEAEWYAAGREVIKLFDYIGVHLYGQTDNSLVTYALQLASVFGKPMLADEMGNTDRYLSPDNKAFAVASYLQQAAEAGVVAATIFIAQTPTEHWLHCTLPTDKLAMIADSVPQEVTMPIPTIIEAVSRPVAQQGGQVAFTFDAHGIDGIAKGFADVAYPVIPGSQTEERYGPNLTTELPTFGNGRHTVTLNVPPVATPTPGPVVGGITLRIVEMDGVTWDGGVFGPYPVDLVPGFVQPPVVTPEPPAPVPVALPPAYDIMWERAGDVVNAATAVGDEELAERGRDIHRTIVRRKEGR